MSCSDVYNSVFWGPLQTAIRSGDLSREKLGRVIQDALFAKPFSMRGQPSLCILHYFQERLQMPDLPLDESEEHLLSFVEQLAIIWSVPPREVRSDNIHLDWAVIFPPGRVYDIAQVLNQLDVTSALSRLECVALWQLRDYGTVSLGDTEKNKALFLREQYEEYLVHLRDYWGEAAKQELAMVFYYL